ncbi:TetR/AcrR family transcriptional regulator (plasmid) [Deinococcus sp. KNUC1210]|uniref:TetR/AcrR family transcriptional regulator n=1 Tax=Deinococcus sp. KNUC1210 TaxID=2917691 RepID=UPI001EEFF2FE|nr:TetR/AcrR family transcriptional regulator [Deinococcus sp. KNUC1210]ULH18072.1 TetR/AcrR family transcriptional regulator [Deinococcus sp. KNUC1210]
MTHTIPRVDPRILRTRRSIQAAFQTLLSEQGLAPLTVQDITARAGVNRATFYAHYQDKYTLFAQVLQEHLDALLVTTVTWPLTFDAQGLRSLLTATCLFMAQVHDQCHVHDDDMEMQINQQVQQRLGDHIRRSLSDCQQAPNSKIMSRELLATLTASSVYAAALIWGRAPAGRTLEAYVTETLVFVLAGVEASGFRPLAGRATAVLEAAR